MLENVENLDPEVKKERDRVARKKGKELLGRYVKKFRVYILFGLLLNILGMANDLTNPLFMGYIIDAIKKG